MKFGDQVILIENGKEYSATVLGARILDHHLGANDEPLLQLGFFKEVPDPADPKHEATLNVIGTARQSELVQFRADVAHESHEFGAAAAQANLTGIYPGGRWREAGAVNAEEELPPAVVPLASEVTFPATPEPDVTAHLDAAGTGPVEEEQKPPVVEGGSEEPPPTVN